MDPKMTKNITVSQSASLSSRTKGCNESMGSFFDKVAWPIEVQR